jgi:hypothetical protein
MKKFFLIFVLVTLLIWGIFILFFYKGEYLYDKNILPKESSLESIRFWTGLDEITVYLDYNNQRSRAIMRQYMPIFRALLREGLITLDFRYVSKMNNNLSDSFYCANKYDKFFEYSDKFLVETKEMNWEWVPNVFSILWSIDLDKDLFLKCMEGWYAQNSLVRDARELWLQWDQILPIIILNGKLLMLENQAPDALYKKIYNGKIIEQSIRTPIPPVTWWQREDGQSWVVDESLFERRIR